MARLSLAHPAEAGESASKAAADEDATQTQRPLPLCRRIPLVTARAPWQEYAAADEDATQTQRPLPLCRRIPLATARAPWQEHALLSSRCIESLDFSEFWVPEWRVRQFILETLRGGAARAVAPWAEIGTDVITSEVVQYSAGVVSGGAFRVAAPFLELGRDALDWSSELFRRDAIGSVLEGHFTRMIMLTKSLAKKLSEQPLFTAFQELVEDTDLLKGNVSYPLMLGMLLAAPHPASGALLLCGQSVTMKAVLMGSAATLGIGSYYLFNRFEWETNRVVQNRAAIVCGVAGSAYLALAYAGGFPPEIMEFFSLPELTLHYATELLVNPLILSNLGYLSGCTSSSMLPTLLFSELSTASFIGSTWSQFNTTQSSLLLCVGVGFMGLTGYSLNKLPELAYNVAPVNRQRVKISSDMLLFSMTLFPLIHGLCIPEVISPNEALKAFAMLDAVTKLGMCHISLKSERVLQNAQTVFTAADANTALPANRQ